jgi:hypothetical protein
MVDFAVAKKEPSAHFYTFWAQQSGNYHNLLTHTLDPQLYVGLKKLFLNRVTPLKATLVDGIIPLYLRNCQ